MFSSRFTFLLALLTVLQVGVCAKEVLLTESDNGGKYTLDVGDTVKITLDGNPTTGFSWEVVPQDGDGFKKAERSYTPSSSLCGAGGTYTFTFKADEQGDATIHMIYSRPWEKGVKPAKTFDVTLSVR
jgi:inhibitor of cysteine peptidase